MSNKGIGIYHGNCIDGFGAAWVVREYFSKVEPDHFEELAFHPGVYEEAIPDVDGKEVIIVDFSYKRAVMEEVISRAKKVTILDHHKSSIEDLAGLLGAHATHPAGVVDGLLDASRSGAMLAWEWFFGNEKPPRLLLHIEDRDLWRFALPGTAEVCMALFSHPYDFEIWDAFTARTTEAAALFCLRRDGEAIIRKLKKDVAEFIPNARRIDIAGYRVPVINMPYFYASEAAGLLADGEPFAACYWDTPTHRIFSLRSSKEGMDVARVAEQFGGGGHKHASGFRVSHGHYLASGDMGRGYQVDGNA